MNTDLGNGIVCNPNGAEKMCEYDVMDVCNTQHEDSCRYATEEEKTKLGGEITLDDVAPKAE